MLILLFYFEDETEFGRIFQIWHDFLSSLYMNFPMAKNIILMYTILYTSHHPSRNCRDHLGT